MSSIALATRGYVSPCYRSVYIPVPHPDARTENLAPEITSRCTSAPRTIVETIPELRPVIRPKR